MTTFTELKDKLANGVREQGARYPPREPS